jgi:hypothetical protein
VPTQTAPPWGPGARVLRIFVASGLLIFAPAAISITCRRKSLYRMTKLDLILLGLLLLLMIIWIGLIVYGVYWVISGII